MILSGRGGDLGGFKVGEIVVVVPLVRTEGGWDFEFQANVVARSLLVDSLHPSELNKNVDNMEKRVEYLPTVHGPMGKVRGKGCQKNEVKHEQVI